MNWRPVFSHRSPGADRWLPAQAGDLLVADDNGVVAVPHSRAAEVMAIITDILAREAQIIEALRQGFDLATARARHGYLRLQSRAAG